MISLMIKCNGCAHCSDLRASSPNDPPELTAARKMEKYYITKWISNYMNGKFSP